MNKFVSAARAGFIAIIGAPNVGKSSLLNSILDTKISIVSPKTQTTRSRIIGIHMEENAQLIFVDTPGIFQPKRRLDRAMIFASWENARQADIVLFMVDAQHAHDSNTNDICNYISENRQTFQKNGELILLINKIDIVKKENLLQIIEQLSLSQNFSRTFLISAKTTDGISDLISHLATLVPEGPWLYSPDQLSDIPNRLLAAEITREKIFLQLGDELPYSAAVETEKWEQKKDGSIRVEQVIYIERRSQKAIVLGKNGSRIKSIGKSSRNELEDLLERKVHLFLFVRINKKWQEMPEYYQKWGLNFNAPL